MKVIKDYIKYLEHIEKLSKTMTPEQKEKLNNILTVNLTMLVALKNYSRMGKVSFNIFNK